jgi:branched-chain amino acid transport system substrate-binding protein
MSSEDDNPDGRESTGTKRRAVLRGLGAAGVVGIGGLSGCTTTSNGGNGTTDGDGSGGDGTTGGVTGTTAAPDIETVNYGVLNPMTGPYSALATEQRRGARMGVEFVNESDEYDFEIEASYDDTEATTEVAQNAARKLVQQENADYLMGAVSSSVALSINPIAAQQEVIYNPGAAAIPITGSECNEYVFRCETNTAQIAETCAEWTLNNLGSNVWFHIADYAYGRSVLREWRGRMQASDADFDEAGVSRAELGASNFDPFISQIANSDADVVVVGATGSDLVRFLTQANSQGLKDDVDVMTTTGSFQVVRQGTGTASYGVYSGVRYVSPIETGDNADFAQRYRDEHGERPDNFARVAFDSIRMTANGIQEAGTNDPTEVKDALAGMEQSPTLFGTNSFRDCDHQAMNPVWVGQNVEPESGETAAVDLIERKDGADVIPPCEETGCSL